MSTAVDSAESPAPVVPSSSLSLPRLLLFGLWAAALFGVLQTHHLKGMFGHAICGPWGCGPPVSALVGAHGFWFLLILPAAAILNRRIHTATAWNLGIGLVLISVAGIAGLLLLEGLNNSLAEQYFWQWCGFRIATLVDIPLVQLGVAGLGLVLATWWTRSNTSKIEVNDANDVSQMHESEHA